MNIPMPRRLTLLTTAATLALLALSPARAAAQGRWVPAYPTVRTPAYAALQESFRSRDRLGSLLETMSEFNLPRNITVEMAECGVPGAFYQPDRPAVRLCYELVTKLLEEIRADGGGDEEFFETFFAVMLHAMGHALVDELNLPLSLPAEEAADLFIADLEREADAEPEETSTMLRGAITLHELGINWEHPRSTEPGMDAARLQKLTCLIYGYAPAKHDWVVSEGRLSESRARACITEARNTAQRWDRMIQPHLRG
ncbi:DUF4344 domain-containing metallopeptidase [Longimicrobium terrae]|uniref:Metallopeptidase DUF4344 n=1 Tax=Longimicrobium terrae TaxID=1639882 RepID=A0A841H5Y6_9BACT|nr:DUF4344 domain-containing metallopeptidase [Longimicrobium terrae]MBB4639378.1 hypothetical protein [Longimicrobium terrae]MBB6073551.1 hypothetical protein [Longimicrobium terrae]NNC29440.1 hypothetical protein [Longimicrobium terrae]